MGNAMQANKAILTVLHNSDTPLDAESVMGKLQESGEEVADKAVIERRLNTLVCMGKAKRANDAEPATFEFLKF